jgi:hypothetical protein
MRIVRSSILIVFVTAMHSNAFAHTTIADQGTEGKALRTSINISHGCGPSEDSGKVKDPLGVVAMSVVFPNGADSFATRVDTGDPISLSGIIAGANDHNGGLVVISPRVVQDFNVFEKITPIRDVNDNVHAVHYTNGFLDPGLTGVVPIQAAAFGSFVSTSCAKKITARVAIANYCHENTGTRRADIWIGETTSVFDDPGVVSVGFWPTLVINRDLVNNPLAPECGAGFDVTLQPSAADIDQNLMIEGFQP